jgi:hypothetical protein
MHQLHQLHRVRSVFVKDGEGPRAAKAIEPEAGCDLCGRGQLVVASSKKRED